MLAFGSRGSEPVVLNAIRRRGDEWCWGQVLESFRGRGVVRALELTALPVATTLACDLPARRANLADAARTLAGE